jgi:hypothetical protein
MGLPCQPPLSLSQIYKEIHGVLPPTNVKPTLETLVNASVLADKSRPHNILQFLCYNQIDYASTIKAKYLFSIEVTDWGNANIPAKVSKLNNENMETILVDSTGVMTSTWQSGNILSYTGGWLWYYNLDGFIWYSTNKGNTWTYVGENMVPGFKILGTSDDAYLTLNKYNPDVEYDRLYIVSQIYGWYSKVKGVVTRHPNPTFIKPDGTEGVYRLHAIATNPSGTKLYFGGGKNHNGDNTNGEKAGMIRISSDYGNTWVHKDLPAGEAINRIHVYDDNKIFAVGTAGNFAESFDGGNTWNNIALSKDGITPIFYDIRMFNDKLGLIVGSKTRGAENNSPFIYRLTYDANNVRTLTFIDGIKSGMKGPFRIHFESENMWYIIDRPNTSPDHRGEMLYMSTDQGVNWTNANLGVNGIHDMLDLTKIPDVIPPIYARLVTCNHRSYAWAVIDYQNGTEEYHSYEYCDIDVEFSNDGLFNNTNVNFTTPFGLKYKAQRTNLEDSSVTNEEKTIYVSNISTYRIRAERDVAVKYYKRVYYPGYWEEDPYDGSPSYVEEQDVSIINESQTFSLGDGPFYIKKPTRIQLTDGVDNHGFISNDELNDAMSSGTGLFPPNRTINTALLNRHNPTLVYAGSLQSQDTSRNLRDIRVYTIDGRLASGLILYRTIDGANKMPNVTPSTYRVHNDYSYMFPTSNVAHVTTDANGVITGIIY